MDLVKITYNGVYRQIVNFPGFNGFVSNGDTISVSKAVLGEILEDTNWVEFKDEESKKVKKEK